MKFMIISDILLAYTIKKKTNIFNILYAFGLHFNFFMLKYKLRKEEKIWMELVKI